MIERGKIVSDAVVIVADVRAVSVAVSLVVMLRESVPFVI
jgi:hypothetical protein